MDITGQLPKLFTNMQQGAKNSQSTKVDKNLLNANKEKIDNLMDEIGDDDDDEKNSYDNKNNNRYNSNIKSNNFDFNYDNTQVYVAHYSQRKNEDYNSNSIDKDVNSLEQDIEDLPSKVENKFKKIIREKKVIKIEKSNTFSDNKRINVRRTIKQKEETENNLSYNNSYSKLNIQREKKSQLW